MNNKSGSGFVDTLQTTAGDIMVQSSGVVTIKDAKDAIHNVNEAIGIVSEEKYELHSERGISLRSTWRSHQNYIGEKLDVLTRVFNLSRQKSIKNLPQNTSKAVDSVLIHFLLKDIIEVVINEVKADRDLDLNRYLISGKAHEQALNILNKTKNDLELLI